MDRLKGYCPMGCGETLFVGAGGYITCSYRGCPAPDAVATILRERESEHLVTIEHERFHVQHPLRERLPGAEGGAQLHSCPLHEYLSNLTGPPRKPGLYRAEPWFNGDGWNFVEVPA